MIIHNISISHLPKYVKIITITQALTVYHGANLCILHGFSHDTDIVVLMSNSYTHLASVACTWQNVSAGVGLN